MIDFKMNTNRHVWIWLMVYSLSTSVVAGVRQQRVIRQGEITEIISNSVTSGVSALISRGERVQRVRRGVSSLSAQDAQASLDKHNNLRKDEGAADMRQMVWEDELAMLAQSWAEGCDFIHGQTDNHSTYSPLGQNLYLTTGNSFNVADAIQAWFDEKADYTYATNDCGAGKVCGHYTQVVWADSFLLGCGVYQCSPLIDSEGMREWASAIHFVCNYAPAGNYVGEKPYIAGTACTKCGTGVFNCNPDGLCADSCTSQSCECKACTACQNCATIENNCTCSCQDGYTGVDCSEICEDTHENCNASPGWPPSWCTDDRQYVLDGCPLMCGLCRAGNSPTGSCDNGCPDDGNNGSTDGGNNDDNDDGNNGTTDNSTDDGTPAGGSNEIINLVISLCALLFCVL